MKKVLIVDDQSLNQTLLEAYIKQYCEQNNEEMKISTANNGIEAVIACQQEAYDLIFMDILMPVMNGIEATKYLIRYHTEAKIVILTVHDDPDFVNAALDAGATGYVVKSHMATDLLPAVREAIAGHRFISPCLRIKN